MSDHTYFIYILASRKHGTLYIGVTNNLERRIWEHRNGLGSLFVKKYQIRHLVHFEAYSSIHDAISREKSLKNWLRTWKVQLIEADNPDWTDLAADWPN